MFRLTKLGRLLGWREEEGARWDWQDSDNSNVKGVHRRADDVCYDERCSVCQYSDTHWLGSMVYERLFETVFASIKGKIHAQVSQYIRHERKDTLFTVHDSNW